jgi:hypothetical protein
MDRADYGKLEGLPPLPGVGSPIPDLTPEELESFRRELEGFALTDAERDEFILAMWAMMTAFVDLAWGMDPVQLVVLDSKDGPDRTFNQRTDNSAHAGDDDKT